MIDCSKVWSTHPTKFIFFSSMRLFLDIITSSTFFYVILNDLKQNTLNSYRTCDVWDGNLIKSNPNSYAYSHYENKRCLLTGLELNFGVAMTICNSLYMSQP